MSIPAICRQTARLALLGACVAGWVFPCVAVELRLSDGTTLSGDTLSDLAGDFYVQTMFGKVPVTRADIAAIDGIPYQAEPRTVETVQSHASEPVSPAEALSTGPSRDTGGPPTTSPPATQEDISAPSPDESTSFDPPPAAEPKQSAVPTPAAAQERVDRARSPADILDSAQSRPRAASDQNTPSPASPDRQKHTPARPVSLALPGTVTSGKELLSQVEALCDSLVRAIPPEAKTARVAVLPFESSNGSAAEGRAVAEYFVAGLQSRGLFTLVDRMDFQKVLGEIALSQSGMMDQSRAVDVGRMMAAEYVFTGTIAEVMGLRTVAVRLIHVETGTVAVSAVLRVGESALGDIAKELLSERSNVSSSVFRSLVIPGWGQMYSRRTGRGIVSLVCCVGGLAASVVSAIDRSSDYSAYSSYGSRMEQPAFFDSLNAATVDGRTYEEHLDDALGEHESLYDEYSTAHGRTLIFAAATAGLWALNLVDAAIAGGQNKKRLELYFGAAPSADACLYAGVTLQWRVP